MNSKNLQAGQFRHDNAEPPVPWIETPAGKGWLADAISALILGMDVTIDHQSGLRVTAADFISEFAQRSAEIYSADATFALEWALARGNALNYQALAREVASEMLMPHRAAAELALAWLED